MTGTIDNADFYREVASSGLCENIKYLAVLFLYPQRTTEGFVRGLGENFVDGYRMMSSSIRGTKKGSINNLFYHLPSANCLASFATVVPCRFGTVLVPILL